MNTRVLEYRVGVAAVVAGLLSLGGWVRSNVAPQLGAPQALTRADQEKLEHTASASLFGELRGGLADYLWLKADRLVHNGVEMRALTSSEQHEGRRWRSSEAHGEKTAVARHEEGETTVVPNPEADHRGILGNLERQVEPYMDMRHHRHRDPGETAALFRLMTWANPHFVPAWLVGANVLAENLNRPKDALAFLWEGEAQNPNSLEIQAEIGRYLLYHYHNGPAAEARFRRAVALGAAQPNLSDEASEAWENAHRWLVIEYYRAGRRREARDMALAAIRRFPQSRYFRRALERHEGGERAS